MLGLVAERARQLTLDLPDAPGAKLGPLSSFAHRERVERFVESARKQFAALGIQNAAAIVERRPGTGELRIGVKSVELARM